MRYFSTAETAKMIRATLKAAFPAVKFSVRSKSYSGGSSIRVNWTDGPTPERVDDVVSVFNGHGFDGSIDMGYSINAWILNGKILGTRSTGTTGSRGSVAPWGMIAPHDDAELVSFAGSVSTDRTISPAFARRCAAQIAHYYGVDMPAVLEGKGWDNRPTWTLESDARVVLGANFGEYPSTLIYQASRDASRFNRHRHE
jgi:hypothetical protein